MMRMRLVFVAVGLGLSILPTHAFENFIPMGTGYSTDVDSVPAFDSERGQVIQQADIYETEIYMQKRREAEADSRFNRFFSDTEVSGGDSSIDY
jgi:hypothetical protein